MKNNEIIRVLKLAASILELHAENEFKIKSYSNAVYNLEKVNVELADLSSSELETLQGVGKSIGQKIVEIINTGTFYELQLLLEKTPTEVVKMLKIKGIGPKKVRQIWKELSIETIAQLYEACKSGEVAKLKGFGDKIQEEIIDYLDFKEESKGKIFFANADAFASDLEKILKENIDSELVCLTGEMRRKLEVVSIIQYIIGGGKASEVFSKIDQIPFLRRNFKTSTPYIWRGNSFNIEIPIEIKWVTSERFHSEVYLHSASQNHLSTIVENGLSFLQLLKTSEFNSEKAIFKYLGWQFIEPELREGTFEIAQSKSHSLPDLIEYRDLKGIIHNHSTYSDGRHSLEKMATHCKKLGYEYLGISDHSKTAAYASGLNEEDIIRQHIEIDQLNIKLAPFKIFKGIESDILGDGSLDYEPSVLKSFDFIVASIHSNLKMDVEKATKRLITAIENPYTTFLGHPTGRLLLERRGYPINYQKVIDACAANKVIIEINASPWRLDLDWRWINYALQKGVKLSINPDAHEVDGYDDMYYGLCVARKGGMSKLDCFNTKTLTEVESYFNLKKSF